MPKALCSPVTNGLETVMGKMSWEKRIGRGRPGCRKVQGRERDRLQEKRTVNSSEDEWSVAEKSSLSWLGACESPCKMD